MKIQVTALEWITINDPVGIETVSDLGNPIIQLAKGEYREYDVLDQQGRRLIPFLNRAQAAGFIIYTIVDTSGGVIRVEDEGLLVEPNCHILNISGQDVVAIPEGGGRVTIQHGGLAFSPPLGTGAGRITWPVTYPGYISRPEGGEGNPYFSGGWADQTNGHPRLTTSAVNLFKTINGGLGYTHSSARVTNLQLGQIDVELKDGSGALEIVTLILNPLGGNQEASSIQGDLKIAVRNTVHRGPVVEGEVYIYADIPKMLDIVAAGIGGYFELKVNHTAAPTNSNFGSAFWDDGGLPSGAILPTVLPNTVVARYLSGIRYFDVGSTFDISDSPSGVNNVVNMTVNDDGCIYYLDVSEFNAVVGDVLYNEPTIAGLHYAPFLSSLRLDTPFFFKTIAVGVGNSGCLDARVYATWKNFYGPEVGSPRISSPGIYQIWTYNTSTPTTEYFEDERYRLQDADLSNFKLDAGDYRCWWGGGAGTDLRNWDSRESIDTGTLGHTEGLQFYGGYLEYPVIDFSTGYFFADFNYSVCSGNREFYRAFYVGDLLNHKKFSLTLQVDNLSIPNFRINGGGDDSTTARVDVMFPGPVKPAPNGNNNPAFPGSGWLHCGKYFNAPTFKGVDNDGALENMSLVGNTLTIIIVTGNISSYYTTGTLLVRVRYKDTVPGSIGQITVGGM